MPANPTQTGGTTMPVHFASLTDAQTAYRSSGATESFLRWLDNNGHTYRTI